jgi:hypothetical protein
MICTNKIKYLRNTFRINNFLQPTRNKLIKLRLMDKRDVTVDITLECVNYYILHSYMNVVYLL